MEYGIWVESPGEWTGWCPLFVSGARAIPFKFSLDEIGARLKSARKAYPNATLIEAREAPNEIAWDEEVFRKSLR